MRRVVAAEYLTLDGVVQDPGGAGRSSTAAGRTPYFNDELATYQCGQLFASDALLQLSLEATRRSSP